MAENRIMNSGRVSRRAAPPRVALQAERWDGIKSEILHAYVEEHKPLETVMTEIQNLHGFHACPRTWKKKLSKWGYKKNIKRQDMRLVVAKREKSRKEGKKAEFSYSGTRITDERIDEFQRRDTREVDPGIGTPPDITYRVASISGDEPAAENLEEQLPQPQSTQSMPTTSSLSIASNKVTLGKGKLNSRKLSSTGPPSVNAGDMSENHQRMYRRRWPEQISTGSINNEMPSLSNESLQLLDRELLDQNSSWLECCLSEKSQPWRSLDQNRLPVYHDYYLTKYQEKFAQLEALDLCINATPSPGHFLDQDTVMLEYSIVDDDVQGNTTGMSNDLGCLFFRDSIPSPHQDQIDLDSEETGDKVHNDENAEIQRLCRLLKTSADLAQAHSQHGAQAPQTIQLEFEVAKAAEQTGSYEEAEYRCRKILETHPHIQVQSYLGTMFAKSCNLREATYFLFAALTSFIIDFPNYSIDENLRRFEPIESLFIKVMVSSEWNWKSLSSCMCDMVAKIQEAVSRGATDKIPDQLLVYGFSFAQECLVLEWTDLAEYMYESILPESHRRLSMAIYGNETAEAHRSYGSIQTKMKRWRTSALNLVCACKYMTKAEIYYLGLIESLRVDCIHILPYCSSDPEMEATLTDWIEKLTTGSQYQGSLMVQDFLSPIPDPRTAQYIQPGLPYHSGQVHDLALSQNGDVDMDSMSRPSAQEADAQSSSCGISTLSSSALGHTFSKSHYAADVWDSLIPSGCA